MRRTNVWIAALCLMLTAGLVACGDDDEGTNPNGDDTYTLTFEGNDTFQGPHGGQDVTVAVVDASDGSVVATDDGTVSDSDDPSFSFTFEDVLEDGVDYEVHYYIDSNFGGGTESECDADIDIDHQWAVDIGTATDDVTRTETHDAGTRELVCETFE